MPRGILAYSAYLPHYTMARQTVAEVLGTGNGPSGSRSVASFDEDAITMAVAAARRLPESRTEQQRLFFATSAPPFMDKTNAVVVHAAAGTDDWLLALDLGGLRSGFGALRCGYDSGGIAVLSDMRTGRPGSAEEVEGGDGAAAFLFGEGDDLVAEVLGTSSFSVELMDTWRTAGSEYPQVWEERFSQHVNGAALRDVAAQVAKDTGYTETPTHTLVATPNRRFAGSVAKGAGSAGGTGVQDTHRELVGYCGAAEIGLLLAGVLDTAKAGDTVLLLQAAGGVDAMLLRVLKDGAGSYADRLAGREDVAYANYLTWRGILEREPTRRPERPSVAAPAAFRNQAWKYGLEGSKCRACGKVYLPPQRVCGGCGGVDTTEPYSVADRLATIVSMSTDTITDTPNPPALVALVDFDGGGRMTCELTETRADELEVGSRVEMTFRRTYTVRGVPNYFWKARPVRGTTR
jgi:hydroxymethylglutaryl-CoA synthase